jgi:adenosine deaminase
MTSDGLDAFIGGLPKAELHLHIEGCLEPEMMVTLSRRNKVDIPFKTAEEARAAYRFARLQDFLDVYYQGAVVLRTEEDFRDLALAYFARAQADAVRHAEIFIDPQTHIARGLPFSVFAEGLLAGMSAAQAKFGITSKLILCFLRHLDEDDALATFEAAVPWLDRVAGIGLDSTELGHPPAKFCRLFQTAGAYGLKRVAHAGEEGPPAYVRETLDLLKVDRIDHGNRAMEDQPLTALLARRAMTLTVCPLSNLKLGVVKDMKGHPLPEMLRLGLRATINSDDPSYFGGYVNDNYRAVIATDRIGRDELAVLARNSFLGSFLSDQEVATHLATIDDYVARG